MVCHSSSDHNRSCQHTPWRVRGGVAYDMKLLQPVRVAEGGIRSQSWVLQTSRGKKILKRYKGSVEYEQVLHEHSVLQRLEQANFPAPRVTQTASGDTVVVLEGRYYGMFDFIEGGVQFFSYFYWPSQLMPYLSAVGRSLARLHEALNGFTPAGLNINGFLSETGARGVSLDWYLEKLARCRQQAETLAVGKAHPMSVQLLERAGWIDERLRSDENMLNQANPARRTIHGDYGVYNLLVGPGSRLITLDFEMSRLDWRLVDLVFAFSSVTAPKAMEGEREKMQRIVQGYLSISPDAAQELCLIPQIWTYNFLRRTIIAWERYLDSDDGSLLGEAERRMARVDWVLHNQTALSEL
jgi:Ser/Thr protein kinase RdoA (MazF antagonist)